MKHDTVTQPDLLSNLIQALAALEKFRLDITKALGYGNFKYTFDDIVVQVMQARFDVFVFPNSVILATVEPATQFDTYVIAIAAGDLDEILASEAKMLHEASIRGCKYLAIYGRRGWERPLTKMGWTHDMSIMTKRVQNG